MANSREYEAISCLRTLVRGYEDCEASTLSLVASANYAPSAIREFSSSALTNITTEGYPGKRFHPGSHYADKVEELTCNLAQSVFDCSYANAQPHSASSSNLAVLLEVMKPGDPLMGLELNSGGHLTHGASASFSGKLFKSTPYTLCNETLNYEYIREEALKHRPKTIVCGASSYPRQISFRHFAEIANEVGAILLADISHISGLIIAGEHESPLGYAHVVTTSTYKQLGGPRGGLILSDRRFLPDMPQESLEKRLNKAVFPLTQGTPDIANMAAKAATLAYAGSQEFKSKMAKTITLATQLAEGLLANGFRLVTGGTDTHMVLVDLRNLQIDGKQAENRLEEIGVLANRNLIPGDPGTSSTPSGLRFGTNTLASRNFDEEGLTRVLDVLTASLKAKCSRENAALKREVQSICADYPIQDSGYV